MAKTIIKDPFVSLGGTDLSAHFKSIELPVEVATQTSTAFGVEWEENEPGLKSFTVSLDYNQDYDAGAIDAVLWPMFGTKQALVVRHTEAVVAPANPQYSGMVIVRSFPVISGAVGDLNEGTLELMGTAPLVRATS